MTCDYYKLVSIPDRCRNIAKGKWRKISSCDAMSLIMQLGKENRYRDTRFLFEGQVFLLLPNGRLKSGKGQNCVVISSHAGIIAMQEKENENNPLFAGFRVEILQ